jgi:hypothetical protein
MRDASSDCYAGVIDATSPVSSELMLAIVIITVVALCTESEWRGKLQVNGGP